jgi:polar amino acid transport system substrate-binding protein
LITAAAAATGVGGVCAAETSRELRMVVDVLEPYILPPGHALGQGMDVDLAREALWRGGSFRLTVEIVPWRRVLLELKAGQADFCAGVRMTEERSQYLAFSQPYGGSVRHAFFTRKGSAVEVRSMADLAGRRLGLMAGAEFPSDLAASMTGPIERALDLNLLMRMLAAGRIDVVVGNELPALWLIKQQTYGAALQRQPYTHDAGAPTQMGFSRQRSGFEAALAAMNRGLQILAREKRWEALQAHYVGR